MIDNKWKVNLGIVYDMKLSQSDLISYMTSYKTDHIIARFLIL